MQNFKTTRRIKKFPSKLLTSETWTQIIYNVNPETGTKMVKVIWNLRTKTKIIVL